MSKSAIITIIIFAVAITWLSGIYVGFIVGKFNQQQKIDLPEEIQAITTDRNKPDTLTGYQLNGILYINFKH